ADDESLADAILENGHVDLDAAAAGQQVDGSGEDGMALGSRLFKRRATTQIDADVCVQQALVALARRYESNTKIRLDPFHGVKIQDISQQHAGLEIPIGL